MSESGPAPPAPESAPIPSEAPAPHSRRHRMAMAGEDLGRIISLSDGVFAFALTLLVLSLAVPSVTSNGALGFALHRDYAAFFGFAFAFVMIAIWWMIHNRTFQFITRFDSTLVWLNMMLLAQIAIMPFVLSVYTTYSGDGYQYAVVLFATIQITLGLTSTAIWEYARRAHLTKSGMPEGVSHYLTNRGLASALVFAISIGISFYNVAWAEYSWVLIFVAQRFMTMEGD